MRELTLNPNHEAVPNRSHLAAAASSPGITNGRMLSLSDVAEQLDVSLSTVRRRIAEGALRVHRIGRAIRISHVDLAAFLAATRSKKP